MKVLLLKTAVILVISVHSYLLLGSQLSLTSALLRSPLLWGNVSPLTVTDPCSTSASICPNQKVRFFFFFFFFYSSRFAVEVSGGELNLHTLPPSRGGNRRRLQQRRQYRAPVLDWEIRLPFGEITGSHIFMWRSIGVIIPRAIADKKKPHNVRAVRMSSTSSLH